MREFLRKKKKKLAILLSNRAPNCQSGSCCWTGCHRWRATTSTTLRADGQLVGRCCEAIEQQRLPNNWNRVSFRISSFPARIYGRRRVFQQSAKPEVPPHYRSYDDQLQNFAQSNESLLIVTTSSKHSAGQWPRPSSKTSWSDWRLAHPTNCPARAFWKYPITTRSIGVKAGHWNSIRTSPSSSTKIRPCSGRTAARRYPASRVWSPSVRQVWRPSTKSNLSTHPSININGWLGHFTNETTNITQLCGVALLKLAKRNSWNDWKGSKESYLYEQFTTK